MKIATAEQINTICDKMAQMENFEIEEISDKVFSGMKGKSYPEDCWVPREDLRLLKILYVNFNDEDKQGHLVCNKFIAEDLLEILHKLYCARYQLENVGLVDYFDADDNKCMNANFCSSFNFRDIESEGKISYHALGLAVDINPVQNPLVSREGHKRVVCPENGEPYADREKDFAHKIDENDLAYKLFAEKGFKWGGIWEEYQDYQHFYVTEEVVKLIYPNIDFEKSAAENAEACGERNKQIKPLYQTVVFKIFALIIFLAVLIISLAFALAPSAG